MPSKWSPQSPLRLLPGETEAALPASVNRITAVTRQEIIERERRLRPWAVFGAAAPLVLYMAAQVIETSAGLEVGGLATEQLRSIDENSQALLYSSIARAIGFALLAVPLVYLFRAAQARTERVNGLFLGIVIIGPVLLATQGLITWSAQTDVAAQFVEQSPGVGDIYTLADNIADQSGALSTATGLVLPAMLSLIFAMIYVPLWAMRTGLLSRFFGTTGMALGALIIMLLQFALLLVLCWFLYLSLVLMGRIPRGRPPAWDAGEAIPWPRPGEEEPVAASEAADVVEGDATEIPGVGENPNAARRERAKRRKRKRRH